ncbi:hypothetical protein G6F37_008979 [Rhizopus arrhizus]|nr:hypothetical protein G6F38_003213 [Rhizopus arrhizus]KAG1154957.1 hypothetical protein G6F37_008979 [Rhizopus arrhizus]
MKGKQKDTLFSSNQKEPSKSENDSFELCVENNSDDDFQPVVTARKRKSRENTPQSVLQKRLKGKGKDTDSEFTTTSSTGISTIDEPTVFSKITLDDYDLEYSSDNFDAPVIKRLFLGESTRSAFCITKSTSAVVESSTTASKTSLTFPKPSKPVPTTFKSAVTSVKSSFCPVPVDKASDIKEGPKKISKRVMTIKTTVKNIWKSAYLQALYHLAHTTNLLVTDSSVKSQLYATYLQTMLQQKHISERLDDSEKSKVLELAKEMYRRPQQSNYKKAISAALEKLQVLSFRKLKFSKPTRNKGLIRMLKKNGFVVYLINEDKTSSHCPTCENELEKFKTVPNPRPYQRKKKPDMPCNGLLRCKSLSCLKQQATGIKVAVLNFLKILNSLRKTGKRPSPFTRKYPLD